MNRYPNYALANLPWLDKIPSHWSLERNKTIFKETKDTVGENASSFRLLSLTKNGIILRDMASGKGKFPKDFDTYKVVEIGDMAFCLFDIDETPRTVGLSGYNGMLTGAYTIFHVRNINSRYVYYYYLSLDNVKALRPLYSGLRKTINVDTFLGTKLPVPPREEQDQIVRFLDWKVSGINKLISIRKKEILSLEELKKSKISRAVTKGLNLNIPLIDSGVEWVGKIPRGWELVPIKHLFKIYSGATPKSDMAEYWDGDIIWITPADYKTNDRYIYNGSRNITAAGFRSCSTSIIPSGSIIFSKRAPVGTVAINKVDLCTNQGCLSCIPKNGVFAEFYYYVMSILSDVFESVSAGTTFKEISLSAFGSMKLQYPPFSEQEAIVSFLDTEISQIDKMVSLKKQQIDKLVEMKESLISDAVTGKIDVRGIEIPEYEYVSEEAGLSDDEIDDEEYDEIGEQED